MKVPLSMCLIGIPMHPLGHDCKGDESDEAASQQRQSLDC